MISPALRELLAGLVMIIAGLFVGAEAYRLGFGTADRTGPGAYPMMIAVVLVVVGVLIAIVREQADPDSENPPDARPDWRGWACIILGMLLFVLFGEYGGLGPATFACVFVSAWGDRSATLRESLIVSAGMTALAYVVFSRLLSFQLPFLHW